MLASTNKSKFNHDLLAHPEDVRMARELYPGVVDALYHPELIEFFKQFDDPADHAKRKSRRWGILAIFLGGIALAMAAVDVAVRALSTSFSFYWLLGIGLVAASLGLFSAAVGTFGTLIGRRKHEWLINRFMGETTRQFHFQSLIEQLPLIIAMARAEQVRDERAIVQPKAEVRSGKEHTAAPEPPKREFVRNRHLRFLAFQAEFDELSREAKFGATVDPGEVDWHLCETREFALTNSAALQTFFDAYRDLRLQHQLNYAHYKLTSDSKIFSNMPRRQAELLAAGSKFGIQFVVLINFCVFLIAVGSLIGPFRNQMELLATEAITGIFAFAIIVVAVVSICAHTFAQGLQPEREVERYQQYGSAVKSILVDFDSTEDAMEKVKIMRQMERAAFDEMRNFLITHHERSSFAM